jgi:vacuolar protein sorting-associated protein IST1
LAIQVINKLTLDTPSAELVDAYLFEIAKGYGIQWAPPNRTVEEIGGTGGIGGEVRLAGCGGLG